MDALILRSAECFHASTTGNLGISLLNLVDVLVLGVVFPEMIAQSLARFEPICMLAKLAKEVVDGLPFHSGLLTL